MSITDEQLQEIAEQRISDAIADLAHDRMGLSEMLEEELEGLGEEEQEAVMDRLEVGSGSSAAEAAASFARALMDAWGVGASGCNDGTVVLLSRQDRQVRGREGV